MNVNTTEREAGVLIDINTRVGVAENVGGNIEKRETDEVAGTDTKNSEVCVCAHVCKEFFSIRQ